MLWLAVEVAVVAVVCFLIGSINPATLVARALGRDLRGSGSGNPGATNAGRVLGREVGRPRPRPRRRQGLAADLRRAAGDGDGAGARGGVRGGARARLTARSCAGEGGKGVACALGAVLAVEPFVALAAVVVFAVTKTLVPFVGEASVVAVLVDRRARGAGRGGDRAGDLGDRRGVARPLAALVLSRHRRNIVAWVRRLR